MTAIVSSPARSWVGAHRMFTIVVSFAITLAAAATFAIVLLASGSGSTTSTTSTTPSSWPVSPENLSDYDKCVMAHVRVC